MEPVTLTNATRPVRVVTSATKASVARTTATPTVAKPVKSVVREVVQATPAKARPAEAMNSAVAVIASSPAPRSPVKAMKSVKMAPVLQIPVPKWFAKKASTATKTAPVRPIVAPKWFVVLAVSVKNPQANVSTTPVLVSPAPAPVRSVAMVSASNPPVTPPAKRARSVRVASVLPTIVMCAVVRVVSAVVRVSVKKIPVTTKPVLPMNSVAMANVLLPVRE